VADAAGNADSCFFDVTVLTTVVPPDSAYADRSGVCPGDGSIQLMYGGGIMVEGGNAVWYNDAGLTNVIGTGDTITVPAPAIPSDYYVRFEGTCDTSTAVSVSVAVKSESTAPLSAASDRNNICPGDGSVTLSYTGGSLGTGAIAHWYSDPALSIIVGTGNDLNLPVPLQTTPYFVRFEGDCDSTTAVGFILAVNELSVAPTGAGADRDTVCVGTGSITLSYSGGMPGTGAVAVWYDDVSMTNSIGTGNDLSISVPATSTTYFVRFEGDCNITASASVTITVQPAPIPVFTEKTEDACINGPLYRYVVSGQAGSVFTWYILNGTIVFNYNDTVMVDWGSQSVTGKLKVTETTSGGCISEPDSVMVNVSGPVVDLGDEREICLGEPVTIIPEGSFTTHMWHDGSTEPSYTADTTELVRIQVFNQAGCTAFDSVQVSGYPTPSVDLGNETTLCGEMSLVLDAGNPGSVYEWSTGETTQQIEVFAGEQFIWVVVTNFAACSDSSSIRIRPCSPKEFFANIANTITPNGDDRNDTWKIDEAAAYPNIEIEIFDRWGKLVWKSTRGYSVEWDGKNMNGRNLPMDSYFYVIHLNDGSDQITGTITIMR
jgi:gliding motility-associated-like protein